MVHYLTQTKKLGIWFHYTCQQATSYKNLELDDFIDIPSYLSDEFSEFSIINLEELIAYTDEAYGNDPGKR